MKGFIFSIDTMGAIAVVAVLGIAWVFLMQQETENVGEQINRIARDNSMTEMYTNAGSTESLNDADPMETYRYCKNYYSYNTGANTANENMKCEGIK